VDGIQKVKTLGKCEGCFFSKNRRIGTAHVVETGVVGKSAGLVALSVGEPVYVVNSLVGRG
jgi:hypothetical protein